MFQFEHFDSEAGVENREAYFLLILLSKSKHLVYAAKLVLDFLLLILELNVLTGTRGASNKPIANLLLDLDAEEKLSFS